MVMDTIRKMLGGDRGGDEITCMEALEQIYDFMDGELEAADSAAVQKHFEVCTACYPHLKMEENFRRKVQSAMARAGTPTGLRDRVLTLLDEGESEGEAPE